MRRLILALLVLVAGVLVYAWRSSISTLPSRSLDNPEPQIAAPSQAPEVTLVAPSSEREEVQLPGAPPPATPPNEAIEDRLPGVPDAAEWAKHYEGWSTARLEARLNELEPLYQAEVDRLCELRFAARQYRVIPASEMEGEDSAYDVLASYDVQGVLSRTRAVPGPDFDPANPVDDDGSIEYQVVQLPPDIYPELYRQRTEVEWLTGTLAARAEKDEDPP